MKRRELIGAGLTAAILTTVGAVEAAEAGGEAEKTADKAAAEKAPRRDLKDVPFPVKGKVTIVDFGASWCASCPEMAGLMKQMQKEYGDKAAFITIDIDEWQGIEDVYLIDEMPAQIFYDRKGEPIWKHVGPVDADTMRERVNILLEG